MKRASTKYLIKFLASIFVFELLVPPALAFEASDEKPIITEFTVTPDSVDITSPNQVINFQLLAFNSTGIFSNQVKVNLSDGSNNSLSTILARTDFPIRKDLTKVIFKGSLVIPPSFPTGVYTARSENVIGMNSEGKSGYLSDIATATTSSRVIGAENSLLIRNNEQLGFKYSTFVGPTWNKLFGVTYSNTKFISIPDPIWKVNEIIDLRNYYEMKVPSLPLKLISNSPKICLAENTLLKLLSTGSCSFTVYTDATADYLTYKIEQNVDISPARVKPQYVVNSIPTQSSTKLPLLIEGPLVNGPLGLVFPTSETPNVCFGVGSYIKIISGGICKLNYSSLANSDYLASDVYTLMFEISRNPQTISFTLPEKINLKEASLILRANSSAGLPISFKSINSSVCEVAGSILKLLKIGPCELTATQEGTVNIAPATTSQIINIFGSSERAKPKKLFCVKNGKNKAFTAKKCPKGYKLKP